MLLMMTVGGLPRVGEVLRGKYELVRTLGEGGMAVVFEARQKDSGQRVAIKVLAPELARDPELVARFDREARAVGRLRTRHVAHVVEVGATESGVPFMVMDFLDGRDLASELESRKTLPIEEAVDYVLQTAAAMDEAHRAGIVHRDLKPANLFLADEGALRTVKILDFGISKVIGEASKLTGAGAVMGTVIYMSPEQVKSSSDVDRRADIWSLGVILFELLAGRAPFEGPGHKVAIAIVSETAPDVRTFVDVPVDLAAAIARMLERDPNARCADMREVARALAPFVAAESHGARAAAHLGGKPPSSWRSNAGKTMPLHPSKLLQRTVPMGFALPQLAGAAPVSSPAPSGPGSSPSPGSNPSPSRVPPSADPRLPSSRVPSVRRAPLAATVKINRGASSNAATIIGVALGLLAAAGIVLIILTATRRDPAPVPTASAKASAAPPVAVASASAPADGVPAPSTSAPATSASAPASARVAPPAPRGPRSDTATDAGAPKAAPTENPTLL